MQIIVQLITVLAVLRVQLFMTIIVQLVKVIAVSPTPQKVLDSLYDLAKLKWNNNVQTLSLNIISFCVLMFLEYD